MQIIYIVIKTIIGTNGAKIDSTYPLKNFASI